MASVRDRLLYLRSAKEDVRRPFADHANPSAEGRPHASSPGDFFFPASRTFMAADLPVCRAAWLGGSPGGPPPRRLASNLQARPTLVLMTLEVEQVLAVPALVVERQAHEGCGDADAHGDE